MLQAGKVIWPPLGLNDEESVHEIKPFQSWLSNIQRYPAELAVTFERGYTLRQDADYEDYAVSKPQAERQFRRARVFVTAIKGGEKR